MSTDELSKLNRQLMQYIKDEEQIYNEVKRLDNIIIKLKSSPINKVMKSNMLKASLRKADYNKKCKYVNRLRAETRLQMAKINWTLKYDQREALCKETTDISVLEKHNKLLDEADQMLETAKKDMENYPSEPVRIFSKYPKISFENDPQLRKFRNN